MNFKELAGARFGSLVVHDSPAKNRNSLRSYTVTCDCGTVKTVKASYLLNHQNKGSLSCGCRRKQGKGIPNPRAVKYAPEEAAFRSYYTNCKSWAKTRGKTFTLTAEEVRDIATRPCHYCTAPPSQVWRPYTNAAGIVHIHITPERAKAALFVHGGIDRVDNTRGYEKDNVVASCSDCNSAKMDMSVEKFTAWLDRIARNHGYTK